jgi:hypothetical protein
MVPTTGSPPSPVGVFDPADNQAITGDTVVNSGDPSINKKGLHPTTGGLPKPHPLGFVVGTWTATDPVENLDKTPFVQGQVESFEHFIWDKTVTARPTPVNKDKYLLISAGPDGLYGNTDDVTNFGK